MTEVIIKFKQMDLHNTLRSKISQILSDCEETLGPPSNHARVLESNIIQHSKTSFQEQFSRFIQQFSNVCSVFKQAFVAKPNPIEAQIAIGNSILLKLDTLIDVNTRISEGLEKVTNQISNKLLVSPVIQNLPSNKTEKQVYQPQIVNDHLQKVFLGMKKSYSGQSQMESPSQCEEALEDIIEDCFIPNTSPLLNLAIPRIFAASSMIYPPESDRQMVDCNEGLFCETTKQIGQQYINDAEYYFKEYSQARLTYDDMKIKFSESILYRMIGHSEKWISYFNKKKQEGRSTQGNQREVLEVFDHSTKSTLTFLINKYPPSRRKIIDTELTEKIPEMRIFSIAKYDILKNAGSLIGLDQNQKDFTRDIKLFLNKILKETREQYPKFKQTMKTIFTNTEGSIDGSKLEHNEVDYIIGSKLSQSVQPYSEFQLSQPGLEIKSSEILRILMKWVQDLHSYFSDSARKVLNNRFGFKTKLLEGIPIKIPRSKKEKLAENLRTIYNKSISSQIQNHKKEMSILIFHLVKLGLAGVENHDNLNEKELVMLKSSECISEVLRSSVVSVLTILLQQLSKIGTLYKSDEVESNIQLVTFGVTDLLRCKCIGSKAEIYRIYNEIQQKTEYFEVIRVKNKLNESTRDILINLKLKNSFLICQVQLSLGDSAEEVNDHFCHYLYELSRSSFGVLFECANQIWSLDPRMVYIKNNPNIKFKNNGMLTNKTKSCFRSADFIYCSDNHPQVAMKLELNSKPYCCLVCSSFHSAYKSWLLHIECPRCFNSICFTCFNEMKKKNQCLMHRYLKENSQMNYMSNYCFTQSYFSAVADPERMIVEMNKLFVRYQYVAYIVINNLGNTIAVKKRYKNTFIQAFLTVKEIPEVPICPQLPYHWNAILPLKNPVLKTLAQIKSYRKLHISKKWYDIECVLEERGINEVICIVDDQSKSVLVIDIVQTEDQIEATLIQRQISKNVDEYNLTNCGYFQLTSKGISDISFLNNIKRKQTITTLNLWENSIKDITILREFPNVEELYLKENNIESLEPLLGMKHLTIMGLNWNRIKGEIPVLNFPFLQLLDVSYLPELTSLDNLTDSELGSLMMIRANKTKIQSVPRMNLPHLTLLSMAHSNVHDISQLSYSKLPELKKISLNNNKIKGAIPQIEFPLLEYLQLQGNEIQDLQSFSQSQLLNLSILNLSNNSIEGKLTTLNFPSLVNLNLSGNRIQGYNNRLFISEVFKSLAILDLSGNQIEMLEEIRLVSLKKLYLNENKISNLESISSFELPNLEYLNLSKNGVKGSIPQIRFPSLLELLLGYNSIECILNLQSSKLPQLTDLDLSNNQIEKVPCLEMESLKYLNLAQNKISQEKIFDCLHLISGVVEINIQGNPEQLKNKVLLKKKSISIFKLD